MLVNKKNKKIKKLPTDGADAGHIDAVLRVACTKGHQHVSAEEDVEHQVPQTDIGQVNLMLRAFIFYKNG